jgi:hypothetical protein
MNPSRVTVGTEGPFPGGRARPGRDVHHSPPPRAEVMNEYELHFLCPLRLHSVDCFASTSRVTVPYSVTVRAEEAVVPTVLYLPHVDCVAVLISL